MMKKLKISDVTTSLLVCIIVLGGVYTYTHADRTNLPDHQWVEVSGDNFDTCEDAYEWVCETYPATRSIGFDKWVKVIESENATESMVDSLIYSPDEIFLKRRVNLCVIDSASY